MVNPGTVGIILVVYNQKHNLERLYNSLTEQSYKNFRIFFVDNHSSDRSMEFSKKLNENLNLKIDYLKLNENSGFAKGNNAGAEAAHKEECKHIFFLNNDMELDKSCIENLVKLINNDSHLALASGLILYENRDVIQEFGGNVDFDNYVIRKFYNGEKYNNSSVIPETLDVQYVSGGASFMRTDAFLETGLWEEKYFAYGDEIDLCRRIIEKGYTIKVTKDAVLRHFHNWSKQNKSSYYLEYYLIQRNKYLYFYKYNLKSNLLKAFVIDSVKFPVRLWWFKKKCDFKLGLYYLRGTFAGLIKKEGKPSFLL